MSSLLKFCSICFILLSSIVIFSQEETTEEKESKPVETTFAIDNISDETERVGVRILDLQKILAPSSEVTMIDSVLEETVLQLNLKKDTLLLELNRLDSRDLTSTKVEWKGYRSRLKGYQNVLNSRSKEIGEVNDELVAEIEKWETTKQQLADQKSEAGTIYNSLDDIIVTLQEVIQVAHTRLDAIFIIQKSVTELILSIDEVVAEVESYEVQRQKNYLVFDSKPLWKLTSKNAVDSTAISESFEVVTDSLKVSYIDKRIGQNEAQLKSFFTFNLRRLIAQIVFILLLFSVLMFFRKKWKDTEIEGVDKMIAHNIRAILGKPIAATLVVGMLIGVFFYDGLIPILSELYIFIVLVCAIVLLPAITTSKLRKFLVILFVIYLLQFAEAYIENTQTIRLMVLVEGILLSMLLFISKNGFKSYTRLSNRMKNLIRFVLPIYSFIVLLSVIANIIGMMSLSNFLLKGVLFSIILGLVAFLAVHISISLLLLAFKFRTTTYNMHTLETVVAATNQRLRPTFYWIGFMAWLYFTLKSFQLYHFFLNWLEGLLVTDLVIGETTISLGGILAFLLIFGIAIFISKLIATIFQDDWLIKVLPRGIAPAISLVLRILLISIGLYVGLSAAGLDLSKLGFIVGALGVGIGFGLQNVVLNFIAGLILAFERPINLGDTIEVDNEFGVITSIGVRSSNIRTYAGAETIIPNGDLISKKVINWTLSNRDRRSKIFMKTAPSANPKEVMELFLTIAKKHPSTQSATEPSVFFKGYSEDGNLQFELWYWTTFSETLGVDNDIALEIFEELKTRGIDAPVPTRRIIKE